MATDISKEINQLKNAVYGEEVRGAFVSCMEKIHEENESYDNIKAQVAQSAENVEKQVGTINTKAEEVQTSLDNLADAISNGKKQQTAIEQSVEKGKTQQTNLEETIKNAKTQQSAMIEELEENSNTQVNNFNTHVAEKTQESEQAIADARQQAVQTITKQEALSVQTVKDETAKYIEEQKNAAKEEIGSRADEKIEEINQAYKPLDEKVELLNEDVDTLKNDTKELNDKKITKFYASNQGETHITDSDNGKIQDMVLYGKSEQKQYKGINLFSPDTKFKEYIEVSISKGSFVFWATDGTPANGGNFRFFNEDKTESMWFGLDSGTTSKTLPLTINAKYVQNLVTTGFDLSKICLGIGSEPIYEPYTGGIPSPSPDYPQEIKSVVNPTVKVSNEGGTQFETVTLPYTLNAILVSSGGNVAINGKQYIADYVDVERGKYVQMIQTDKVQSNITWTIQKQQKGYSLGYSSLYKNGISTDKPGMGKTWKSNVGDSSDVWSNAFSFGRSNVFWIVPYENDGNITSDDINAWLVEHPMDIMYPLAEPIETDLTPEENEAFKALVTNYPVTNISVTSDQLDGYTVFNYPISMVNGWNYVKQQIGDTREYIYDIDARTQDTDLQAAEAYVNSEYAVALIELEVM